MAAGAERPPIPSLHAGRIGMVFTPRMHELDCAERRLRHGGLRSLCRWRISRNATPNRTECSRSNQTRATFSSRHDLNLHAFGSEWAVTINRLNWARPAEWRIDGCHAYLGIVRPADDGIVRERMHDFDHDGNLIPSNETACGSDGLATRDPHRRSASRMSSCAAYCPIGLPFVSLVCLPAGSRRS